MKHSGAATVAQLAEFDEIIDARSPAEFSADHIPGAINLPVLTDEERAKIGTIYNQVSSLEAKKLGAAMVSRNIAHHLEVHFLGKPRNHRPLVYCWRGGNRSGSLTHVLQKIGFAAAQLVGGYKGYRRKVIDDLESLPGQFQFRVICGPTGSGKSRLLQALTQVGAQVLDLEVLAAHRGSVLGVLPDQIQPTQKSFESALWNQLHRLSPDVPVFVESESRRIGDLQVPNGLIIAMRSSPCIQLELQLDARARLLLEDYKHFVQQPDLLIAQLNCLTALRGKKTVDAWQTLVVNGDWPGLVSALLNEHYDPAYRTSLAQNYGTDKQLSTVSIRNISQIDFELAARSLLN
ncbi:MAG: tRNA 2-selenouridine(34) synthase MnmH [Thiobacillaceae bacterium]